MSTLTEIEKAIEGLTTTDRAKLARWWGQRFDPDEGLELREEVAAELDAARKQILDGEVADWEQMKDRARATGR